MANRDVTVDADRFGISMRQILEQVDGDITRKMPRAVRRACQRTTKVAKAYAPVKTGKYKRSLSYKVRQDSKGVAVGVCGSKKYPGLVHLLEKGHATIGGGKVEGHPHMGPGFEAGVPVLIEELNKVVDESL